MKDIEGYWEECDCPCHQSGSITIHIQACCSGQCEKCGCFIKGSMGEHLKVCHGNTLDQK